ncbi:uncharacterized protein C10orf95 homolog [Perognathus longimembris pacificus]|uniref:uncharacterized protein C10orf95 homolog n=1 Tax=Perognathus longimembris pacificus TaxID=214514 RepID=UPI0020198787|nr:uncharacterized protein C10orf95 homolog [Perognathus longimembris pacificus]
MYSYGCLARWEDLWPGQQPLPYTYPAAPLRLPPIQTYRFCGQSAAPREYHRFYRAGAPLAAPPWWNFLPPYAEALGPPFSVAAGVSGRRSPPVPTWESPWPEGGSVQAELRWGRVERTRGPRLPLPAPVRRELRRVYGTYPHTDVRVTHRRGEFLLDAAPRVGEPEYRVERRLERRPQNGPDGGGPARKAGERGRRPERRGRS